MEVTTKEHRPGSNSKEKLSTRSKIIAAFGAGTVATAAVFGISHVVSGGNYKGKTTAGMPYNENYTGTVTVDQKNTVATGETLTLLQEHSKNLDEWRGLTLDILKRNHLLSAEEQTFLETNYATLSQKSEKSTYTNKEVLAANALDLSDVSSQGDDWTVGHNMLPLVVDKGSTDFNDIDAAIGNGKGAIIDVYQPEGPELRHPVGSFIDEDLKNTVDARAIVQSKILGINDRTVVLTEVGVYALYSDGKGNEQWRQEERYNLNHSKLQTALDNLR